MKQALQTKYYTSFHSFQHYITATLHPYWTEKLIVWKEISWKTCLLYQRARSAIWRSPESACKRFKSSHTKENPQQGNCPLFMKDIAMKCLLCTWQHSLEVKLIVDLDGEMKFMYGQIKRCTCASGHLPIVSPHNLQDPLLHVFKRYGLHVGIRRTSLLRCRGSEVVHHFLQFKKEVVLKLRPLDPAGKSAVRLRQEYKWTKQAIQVFFRLLLDWRVTFTYKVSPVLAIWHRNCSRRGHASFFAFLSKSEETTWKRGVKKRSLKWRDVLPWSIPVWYLGIYQIWFNLSR